VTKNPSGPQGPRSLAPLAAVPAPEPVDCRSAVVEQLLASPGPAGTTELTETQRRCLARWMGAGLELLSGGGEIDETGAEQALAPHGVDCARAGIPLEAHDPVVWAMMTRVVSRTWDSVASCDADRAIRLGERAKRLRLLMSRVIVRAYCDTISSDASARDRSRLALALVTGGDWRDAAAQAGLRVPAAMLVLAGARGAALAGWTVPDRDYLVCEYADHQVVLVSCRPDVTGRPADDRIPPAGRPWGAAWASGVDAVPHAVAQALDARRAAAICSTGAGMPVVFGGDLALEAAIADDPALAAELAAPLTLLRGHEPLVETLRIYLASDLDQTRTAAVLGLHRRSLAYRLARITRLAGVDPRSSRGVQIFATALAARRALDAVSSAAPRSA
jgi:hypothetical protein